MPAIKLSPIAASVAPAVLVALAALAALFAVPALAWEEACLRNEKSYDAKLVVVYGFDPLDNLLPHWAGQWTADAADGEPAPPPTRRKTPHGFPETIRFPGKVRGIDKHETARGAVVSAPGKKCVRLRGIADGEPFFAAVLTAWNIFGGEKWAVCDTQKSNPRPFYKRQKTPRPTLWLRADGVSWAPSCAHDG